jgi:L-alanine-DL-glutamate epimerase-like enolase superfamily enzyme
MDLLQAPHTWSGIEIALWDLLGKDRGEPVWKLLGYSRSYPKLPYASQLFGDTPAETYQRATSARQQDFHAVKFGWGPIGRSDLKTDEDHFHAAREGLGKDALLMIDVGQIFANDVESAAKRLPMLERIGAVWLEEPFHTSALDAYAALSGTGRIKLAAGEGAHNFYMAQHLIDYGKVGFIQIDTGRIGGIGPSKRVADYAGPKGVTYVNHTFTSHLALSASLQPYAGLESAHICEYPFAPKNLALELTANRLQRDKNGFVNLSDSPGLGIEINPAAIRRYSVSVEITVKDKVLFDSRKQDTSN